MGIYSTSSCGQGPTSTLMAFRIVSLARGFGISLSTLPRLNSTNPLAAKPALIFLAINTLSLIGLYRKVKYYLLIISIPPYSSYLTYL
jgi:hypothetical protein